MVADGEKKNKIIYTNKAKKNVANNFGKKRKKNRFNLCFRSLIFPLRYELNMRHECFSLFSFFALTKSSNPWTSRIRVEVFDWTPQWGPWAHKNINQRNVEIFINNSQCGYRVHSIFSLCVSGLLIKYNQVNADTTSASFEFSKWIAVLNYKIAKEETRERDRNECIKKA